MSHCYILIFPKFLFIIISCKVDMNLNVYYQDKSNKVYQNINSQESLNPFFVSSRFVFLIFVYNHQYEA